MAPPTKRKSNGKADTTTDNNNTKRATRSSARFASQGITNPVVEAVPKTKKAKLTSKDKKPEPKAKVTEAPLAPAPKAKATGAPLAPAPKAKATEAPLAPAPKAKATKAPLAPAPETAKVGNGAKTVVIEHCKQCTQFKIRAVKVKDALEKSVSGITVLVNPEKPRRGCFEVREEGGKTFISLLDMKRPFAPMKALDMDAVISEIVDQVK